jgi:hypothetical protein
MTTEAYTERVLGDFPTKLSEAPLSGADIRVDLDYHIPKPKGRPKGAKDKTPRKRRTKKEIEEAKQNGH